MDPVEIGAVQALKKPEIQLVDGPTPTLLGRLQILHFSTSQISDFGAVTDYLTSCRRMGYFGRALQSMNWTREFFI